MKHGVLYYTGLQFDRATTNRRPALAAVCTVDCAIEIVLITLHYARRPTCVRAAALRREEINRSV